VVLIGLAAVGVLRATGRPDAGRVGTRPDGDGALAVAVRRGDWRALAPPPVSLAPAAVVWTGKQVLAWGGWRSGTPMPSNVGAAYEPATDSWTKLPAAPIAPLLHPAVAWTGRELLVWGGSTSEGLAEAAYRTDGAAYDPAARRWRTIAPVPEGISAVPGVAWSVWTGRRLVVLGFDRRSTLVPVAYDPRTDRWQVLPVLPSEGPLPPVASEQGLSWDGRDLLNLASDVTYTGKPVVRTNLLRVQRFDPVNGWRPETVPAPLQALARLGERDTWVQVGDTVITSVDVTPVGSSFRTATGYRTVVYDPAAGAAHVLPQAFGASVYRYGVAVADGSVVSGACTSDATGTRSQEAEVADLTTGSVTVGPLPGHRCMASSRGTFVSTPRGLLWFTAPDGASGAPALRGYRLDLK
jgi:hypothetical protein